MASGTSDGGDRYVGLDRFGRVVEQRWDKIGNATDRFQYTYDRSSNRLTKALPLTTGQDETYGYDRLNQLTSFSQGSGHSQAWALDALGNWTSLGTDGGTPVARSHNRQNQITGAGTSAFSFDANGNLTEERVGTTVTQALQYDAWNRLVQVTAGGTTVSFSHDALNRRLTETKSGTTTHLYYSAEWQVLEERVDSCQGTSISTRLRDTNLYEPLR